MIKDTDGTVGFEAVRDNEFKKRTTQLQKDYAEAYKTWLAASREAKKAGEDFAEPKPKKPGLRKLGDRIRGEQKAKSMASVYQEKWEAKMRKQDQKGLDKPEDDEPAKDSKKT